MSRANKIISSLLKTATAREEAEQDKKIATLNAERDAQVQTAVIVAEAEAKSSNVFFRFNEKIENMMRRRFSISLFILLNLIPLFASPVSHSQSRRVNLTGNWVVKDWPHFVIDDTGCTTDYSGRLQINGRDEYDEGNGAVEITQKGDEVTIPNQLVTWYDGGNSGSYTYTHKASVSGNKIRIISSTNLRGGSTEEYVGTISADGNTITGEVLCRGVRGPATARGTFTWTRKPSDIALLITYPDYPINTDTFYGYTRRVGHGGVLLIKSNGLTKYYEFGRYDPAKNGQVRSYDISKVKIANDGKVTTSSLKEVLLYLSTKSGKGGAIRAAYFLNVDFDKMLAQAQAKQPKYNVFNFNCGQYAESVVLKGNPKIDRPSIINPTPNNLVDEYIEEGNAEVLFSPNTGEISIGKGDESDAKE